MPKQKRKMGKEVIKNVNEETMRKMKCMRSKVEVILNRIYQSFIK